MLLSVKVTSATRRVALSQAARVVLLDVERVCFTSSAFPDVEVHVCITRTTDGARAWVPLPSLLRELYTLPGKLEIDLRPSSLIFDAYNPVLLPLSNRISFNARHQNDGSIQVPLPLYRGLIAQSWPQVLRTMLIAEGGAEVTFDRMLKHREATDKTAEVVRLYIPEGTFATVKRNAMYRVTLTKVESSASSTARALITDDFQIDWYAARSSRAFTVVRGSTLTINGARSQLSIQRDTPLIDLAWLLGFYLAEGSKTPNDWTISQKGPLRLRRCRDVLCDVIGLRPGDLALEILHSMTSAEQARARYRVVGADIAAVRHTTSVTADAATLRIRGSSGFVDLFLEVLRGVCARIMMMPDDIQWAFLLGCLDGDGTFTLPPKPPARLKYFGADPAEAALVMQIYDHFLGRSTTERRTPEPVRAVNFMDAIALLSGGAFTTSISRARLFHYAAQIVEKLAQGQRVGFASHGYYQGNVLTEEVQAALATWHTSLAAEWRFVQEAHPWSEMLELRESREKGVPYEYVPVR